VEIQLICCGFAAAKGKYAKGVTLMDAYFRPHSFPLSICWASKRPTMTWPSHSQVQQV